MPPKSMPMSGRRAAYATAPARRFSPVTAKRLFVYFGRYRLLFAVVVFAATALISGVGVLVYRQITKHHQKKEQEREAAEKAGHNALDGSAV